MAQHPFDPARPPEEPPPEVRQPMMWRMAVRLVTDHQPRPVAVAWQRRPGCRTCGQDWPCPPHRLGIRGLAAAREDPPPERT